MSNCILKNDLSNEKKKYKIYVLIFVSVIIVAIVINFALCFTYNYEHYALFLALNIIFDVIALIFDTAFFSVVLSVKKHLIALADKIGYGIESNGCVNSISERTMRIGGIDCWEIMFVCADGIHKVFQADCGNIRLERGKNYKIIVVDNIIVEVDEYETSFSNLLK